MAPRRQYNRNSINLALTPERQPPNLKEPIDMATYIPSVWACIGPVTTPELGANPISAFANIKEVMRKGEKSLVATMKRAMSYYGLMREEGESNHSEILLKMAKANNSQPTLAVQSKLPTFPTEYGPGGKTIWALAYTNYREGRIDVSFEQAAAAVGITDPGIKDMPKSGWAIGVIRLIRNTTVLIRCNEPFMLDDGFVLRTPDAYDERRAVSVLHLKQGRHQIFVRFSTVPFWCDIDSDTAEGRRNITLVNRQTETEGPLGVLSDSMMADIIDGRLSSPYVALPIINMGKYPISLQDVTLADGPNGLSISLLPGKEDVEIIPGQSYIVGLKVVQGEDPFICDVNTSQTKMRLWLHPLRSDKTELKDINVTVTGSCISRPQLGYRLTFLDFDGSVQHMWVAPPNVSALPGQRCPSEGCPALMSLHGAAVQVSGTWGRTYEEQERSGFPYPAWLIEPSNRFHWGTDWEGPGYDNGVAALDFVHRTLPGISDADKPNMKLDTDRVLITGHSMGGHGCLVFSVHDPDRLLASLCGACWTSQARYVRPGGSALLDEVQSGLLKARNAEHAADLLARNFRGVPLKIVYGEADDNVPPREPRYMARLVDSYSGSPEAVNITELQGTGHWFEQRIPVVADFLKKHLLPPPRAVNVSWELPPLPQDFEFSVATVSSFGTKGSLKVLQLDDAAHPGRFFVRRCRWLDANLTGSCGVEPVNATPHSGDPDELWYIGTTNLRRFTFKNPPVRGRLLPESVVIDGTFFNVSDSMAGPGWHFCLRRPGATGVRPVWKVCKDTLWESVQRAGPQTDDGPFHNVLRRAKLCIAHGAGPAQAELALVVANKLYFVSRYAVPVIEAVHENMTGRVPEHCAGANMLFIGSPENNTLLNKSRCAFPYVNFHAAGGFTLNGMRYSGPEIGLLAMGRLENDRLALVVYGTDGDGLALAGDKLPITSFRDGADYMVLGRDASWQGEGGVLAAGYLDSLWRPSRSGWSEPEHSVKHWDSISSDGSPEDPRCDAVRAVLLLSDQEISGAASAAWLLAFVVAGFVHLLSA